jgi:hypothetical protein
MDTHRLVFLARIIEMSRFASGFCVFDASASYEVIVLSESENGSAHENYLF